MAEEWADLCPRDANFFDSGMGHHIPVASGLAAALPHREVIVLDTDGSVLMLLSALTTLAQYPPPNLKIFIFDNEAYEGTGSQPTATAGPTDIAAIARGAGVRDAQTKGPGVLSETRPGCADYSGTVIHSGQSRVV